jgi:hypothetical protein
LLRRPKGTAGEIIPSAWSSTQGENRKVALFHLRKEGSKELAKHRKNFEVMESQTVTPIALARDAFARAVLTRGKFARLLFFLHDV